jgi:1-acyl-sn-glycerol-3-phosphate acyltransferase
MRSSPEQAITLERLQSLSPRAGQLATASVMGLLGLALNVPTKRVRFRVEGWEQMGKGPAVLVANHTHWLDWITLRWLGFWRGRHQCNWVKPRTYEEGYTRFLDATGNVPVVSRGYLLAADVRALRGCPPQEEEYRALRNHLDFGTPLPDESLFRQMQSRPRDILGIRFDPNTQTWRQCIEGLFHAMMQATLAHTKALCDQGIDLQIMPQGVTSMRLSKCHPGALQAALALDLPIVPVGINGFPQAFGPRKALLPAHGGTVTVRVGPAYRPRPIEGHVPFLPQSERAHAQALAVGTQEMMARIGDLLNPEHAPGEMDEEGDVVGVARFVPTA